MLRYPTYMAVETLTIALVTEDGQSFEDLGIEERKEGQVIIKCRRAEPMGDGAPCEWNKMGSDGYPFCASSTEVMRLREQNAKLRDLMCDMYRSMDASCQFGHAIPAGMMAHIKNRVIGLGVEVLHDLPVLRGRMRSTG